jgi:hypothetical protein
MSKQVRLRRGTTADHSTFTGADGEITFDTDKKCLVIHDGATPGGTPLSGIAFLNGDQVFGGQIWTNGGTPGYGGSPGLVVANSASLNDTEISGMATLWGVERRPGSQGLLPYASTVDLSFSGGSLYQIGALTGNLTLTTSGRSYGRELMVSFYASGGTRTLTFPSDWIWVGGTAPASLASGKIALLTLLSTGTTNGSIIARYDVQS